MRRIQHSIQAIMVAVMLGGMLAQTGVVAADAANNPSLVISQVKITSSDGQFITLYNATDSAIDMGKYQLEYFNNYDLDRATSSRLITLSGTVPPHGYFMVNDDSLLLCYQLTVDSVSLGLSSTAGFVEVLGSDQAAPGGPVTPTVEDYVGWSKTAAAGAQTLPSNTASFLQRLPVDANDNPAINAAGAGSWQTVQPASNNACNLITAGTSLPASVPNGLDQLLPTSEAPATIINAGDDGTAAPPVPVMPAGDIGLMAPSVTELLPNPDGTGNDSTDEFIELYNPNSKTFDLSGFSLQTGTTSTHTYTFPAGTTLQPQSFTAFYSKATSLSLSNSGGQAKLLDPFGNSISASGVYDTAKDGVAWALAKGKWYWTTEPTPGKANVIKQPAAKKKASSKSASSSKKTAGKGSSGQSGTTGSGSDSGSDQPVTSPIHLLSLALVAGAALLYGAYEYRTDLANRIYRLRQHFGVGYEDRT